MGKGSSKGHTPREAKDNLKSSQMLSVIDAISEGPIEGPVDGLKSVLLNSTPVLDSEGNTNIAGVTVVFRAGEQEQTPPEGFESSGSETVLGTEVKYDTPITRTITSANIDRLRFTFGVQALVETTSKGDRNPSEVRLLVQIQRNGGWVTEKDITIKGKTTSQYLASVVVDKLTAKNADISGNVNANSGTLNNVTINENCQIKGKLSANQIEGDIVKTVSKSFPRTNSYASGTITVRISDDQKFDRQVMIPPVLFRGGKHENFNSNNQQSYWYSTCRLRVTRNGQEIFNQSTTDAQGVFSSVIDMPAGQGTLTLTFTVSSSGANRRQKVQPQQSSQRMRPRPRLLRPLKKPVSHHKVQQKLNCQERRQKVQPVMQPGMQRPQQKKPGSQQKAHSQRNKAG